MRRDKNQTFAPEGAPPRPAFASLIRRTILMFVFVYMIGAMVQHVSNTTVSLFVGMPLLGLACWHIIDLWRDFNRVGWYEQKPISLPDLPFRATIDLSPITFEKNSVTLVYGSQVLYRDIVKVEVLCKGIHFSGLKLTLTSGNTERVGNSDDTGEPARTALAILRDKATKATFEGPVWIEQGWVPRMGFSYPNTGS